MEEIKGFKDEAVKFTGGDEPDMTYGNHATEEETDEICTIGIIDSLYNEGDTLWFMEANYAHRGKVISIVGEDEGIVEYMLEDEEGVATVLDEGELYVSAEALAREIFIEFEPEDIEIEVTK